MMLPFSARENSMYDVLRISFVTFVFSGVSVTNISAERGDIVISSLPSQMISPVFLREHQCILPSKACCLSEETYSFISSRFSQSAEISTGAKK